MGKVRFLIVSITALAATLASAAQEPSPESVAYHRYRETPTQPHYGLSKVRKLIEKAKATNADDLKISDQDYIGLSISERFTYNAIHGEEFTQNCDAMPGIIDEHKKVFAYPPSPFNDEYIWSPRQREFFAKNRTKTIGYLRDTMKRSKRLGCNLKAIVLEINASELIPDMCNLYLLNRKDHDILTVLNLLMLKGKYKPFIESQTYQKLYADEESSYRSFLIANRANQDLILKRAMSFYKTKT